MVKHLKTNRKASLSAFFVCLFCLTSWGQEKQEQEFRIAEKDLHDAIMPLLEHPIKGVKKIKFYKEIDGDKSSYEVKFKKDKAFYSIEFNESGVLEDIEIVIKASQIPPTAYGTLSHYLDRTFGKHQIKKIQLQYVNQEGNPQKVLQQAFKQERIPANNYEIVIVAKTQEGYVAYEVTFDAHGQHRYTRKSVKPQYDHVLF